MYPDNTSHQNQGHGRHRHHTVVHISSIIECLWEDLKAQKGSKAKQLTDSTHDNQDHRITQTVGNTVEEGWPRLVHHGKGLQTTHQDTVGDDQSNIYRQLYTHIISKGLEYLTDDGYQSSHHDQLHNDTYAVRDGLADDRNYHIRECRNDRNGQSHHNSGL